METLHVAAVSSRAVGPGTAWGYLTPLGLGGCRPAALMARTQPAGPRLREAQQHMPNTLAGCRTLHLSPVLAGCRAGDLPRSHALVTGTDAGAGPTDVDGEGLCLQQRINIQAGAYALISRPPFFFFRQHSAWSDLAACSTKDLPVGTCRRSTHAKGPEDAGVPWMKLATVSRLQCALVKPNTCTCKGGRMQRR